MNVSSLYRADDPYEQLISSIIRIERAPQLRMKEERTEHQRMKGVLGDLSSKLSALHTLLGRLSRATSNPFEGRAVTVPEGAPFRASATEKAVYGTHTLQVEQLASADTRVTRQHAASGTTLRSFFDSNGAQTFTVGMASPTGADPDYRAEVSVTVDPTGTTDAEILKEIATALNAAMEAAAADGTIRSDAAAYASLVNETADTARLSLRSGQTGYAGRLTFTDSVNLLGAAPGLLEQLELNANTIATGTGGGELKEVGTSETDSALNARFILDGLTLYRSTNQVTDALEGVTLTLEGTSTETAEFTIGPDAGGIEEDVQAFLEKYNDVLSFLRGKSDIDADAGTRGDFAGDSTLTALRLGLRTDVAHPVTGQPAEGPARLSDLGIRMEKGGTLTLEDAEVLLEAVRKNPKAVHSLFAGDDGLAARLQRRLDRFVGIDGVVDGRRDALDRRIERLDDRISNWDERLLQREEMLRDQFARLQEAIASFQGQQQYLSGFFGGY